MKYSKLAGKIVLITGASGFIGSHLSRALRRMDLEIHALSRFNPPGYKDCIQWWQGDIADAHLMKSLFRSIQPAYIFNLAGYVTGSRELSVVPPTLRSILLGQINLMTFACENGCERFVSVGSMEEPYKNSHQHLASSPYSASKWSASIYGRMFYDLYGLPFVSLRIFMAYGPGQRNIKQLIPYTILSLLRGEAPNITSGKRKVDWIFVRDIVDGVLTAAVTPNIEGLKLDIATGRRVSVRSIVMKLVDLLRPDIKPNFGAIPERLLEQEPKAYVAQTFRKTGWKSRISLQDGLLQTINWYRRNMNSLNEFQLR
jgi:nucleoside-diphosphate-sugar epimerase